MAEWSGEPPPTEAAAELACMALSLESGGGQVAWAGLMSAVERGLMSSDEVEVAAASTGFVEALLFASERESGPLDGWPWMLASGAWARDFVAGLGLEAPLGLLIASWPSLSARATIRAREPWTASAPAIAMLEGSPVEQSAIEAGFEYFLEVSLVKEIAEGLANANGTPVAPEALTENVIHYAINDSYLEGE